MKIFWIKTTALLSHLSVSCAMRMALRGLALIFTSRYFALGLTLGKGGQDAQVLMAHSIGDVPLHTSSYVAAVSSPKRKVALALINDFVEDFKASAPIWKYDLKDGNRIYAEDRSTKLDGAGILS
jgi:MoaE protein